MSSVPISSGGPRHDERVGTDHSWTYLNATIDRCARGYLLKGANNEQTVRAVRAVADGEAIFGPAVATRLIDYFAASTTQAFPRLTPRDRKVLEQIAQQSGNSPPTRAQPENGPQPRIEHLQQKLQVLDRAEAIIKARDAGLARVAQNQ